MKMETSKTLDCGSAEHVVAVPPDRDPTSVRSFATFTGDLHRLADCRAFGLNALEHDLEAPKVAVVTGDRTRSARSVVTPV
jgi:hypothetical protein